MQWQNTKMHEKKTEKDPVCDRAERERVTRDMLHITHDRTRVNIIAAIEYTGDCLTHDLLFHALPYIPRLASLAYISSASFLESGASPMRSKILSGSSPR
jgi:hypothetical protein